MARYTHCHLRRYVLLCTSVPFEFPPAYKFDRQAGNSYFTVRRRRVRTQKRPDAREIPGWTRSARLYWSKTGRFRCFWGDHGQRVRKSRTEPRIGTLIRAVPVGVAAAIDVDAVAPVPPHARPDIA